MNSQAQFPQSDQGPDPVQPGTRMAGGPVFLMLQGPHGPFFNRLAKQLRAAGCAVWRVAFNAGDAYFWSDRQHLIRHTAECGPWPEHLDRLIAEKGVTDIVLYGDIRPVHASARQAAARLGLRLHVFEEGYLRPYWITYERGGSNGHSALMQMPVQQMREVLRHSSDEIRRPPSAWGDMRQHKFYGALYHFLVLTANSRFRGWSSHRSISVWQEFRLNLRKLILSPVQALRCRAQTHRIQRGAFPYVLVLLQLEHDASFQGHSPFTKQKEFTDLVLTEFAAHTPHHHHLVFKAHPLEDGRGAPAQAVAAKAAELGIAERVHFVPGGKLAPLLGPARAVVTVNSTAAQQALWRGLPVKPLGRAVYDKAGLVSVQALGPFLERPDTPDPADYRTYRDFLLQSSQVPGGFYASRSRNHALRLVVDMMLDTDDPYQALTKGDARYRQQLGDDKR